MSERGWGRIEGRPPAGEVAAVPWVVRQVAGHQTLVTARRGALDRGAADSSALAVELGADRTLWQKKEGQPAAQQLGRRVLSVAGIRLEAKAKLGLQRVRPQLDALRPIAGFYASAPRYLAGLALAGEGTP